MAYERALPFTVEAIDHETKEIFLALRGDLAETIAFILQSHADGQNRCIYSLSQQLHNFVDVLRGYKRKEAFREFRYVDVVGKPPYSIHEELKGITQAIT